MTPTQLKALIDVCQRQKLLLKAVRYVALISEEEYRRELADVDEQLKKLEESNAG